MNGISDFNNQNQYPSYSMDDLYQAYVGFVNYVNGPVIDRNGKIVQKSKNRIELQSSQQFEERLDGCTPSDIVGYLDLWTNAASREQDIDQLLKDIAVRAKEWGYMDHNNSHCPAFPAEFFLQDRSENSREP